MNEIVLKVKALKAFQKDKPGKQFNSNDFANVVNLKHGTDENTRYLRQWEKRKGIKAKGCANLNCDNHKSYDALQGAHVKIVGDADGRWYITPLCHVCNSADNKNLMAVYKEDLELFTVIKDIELCDGQ